MTNSNASAKSRQGNNRNTNAGELNGNTGLNTNTNVNTEASSSNADNVVQEAINQEGSQRLRGGRRTSTKLSNGLTADTGDKVPLDVNDPNFQDKIFELNWYLGIANPVFIPVKKNVNAVGSDGKVVSKEITTTQFDHYEYASVNGTPFEDWVKQTFGEDYLVDDVANQVYTLKAKEQPQVVPQPQSETEETQPQNNPEVNPNDPENN